MAFPDINSRSDDIDNVTKGTCEWIFQHETYRRWAVCDRGLLWIKGKPGSGKSTLLQHVLKKHNKEPGTRARPLILTFFFHGRGVELQKTPLGLFRSLLHQILREVPDALQDLTTAFQQRRDTIGKPGEKWQWHVNELQHFFKSSLPTALESRPIWLFIDALDECGEQIAVNIVQEFKSVLQEPLATGLQFRICFTCRHYPILGLNCGFEICLEHENGQDISTYVQSRLSQAIPLIPDTIPTAIRNRASGVFMWARLVIDRVLDRERRGWGWKKIEAEIYHSSPELDALYQELIQDMDEGPASGKLIRWICFAWRPLSLDELRWALIVDSDCAYTTLQHCQSAEDYICDVDMMERRLKTLSHGLAEAVPSSNKRVAQFIHQSVRDFFFKTGISALLDGLMPAGTEASETDMVVGAAHYQLSRTCIRYLAMEEVARAKIPRPSHDSVRLTSEFPLLHYATMSWIGHVKESERKGISQDDLLNYFSWPSEDLVRLWSRICAEIVPDSSLWRPEGTSLVHIVSRYQLMGPLQLILQKAEQTSTDPDVKDTYDRTPLSWASM